MTTFMNGRYYSPVDAEPPTDESMASAPASTSSLPPASTSSTDDQFKDSTAPGVEQRGTERRKYFDAIGITSITIVVLGTAVIAAAVAILAILWRGTLKAAGRADPGTTWESIVFGGWAERLVTVCTAAIRSVVAMQLGLITSMIASLLLERFPVTLQSSSFFSIVRALSIQPTTVLFLKGRDIAQSSSLLCLPVVAVASLITLTLPFLSTILLSDFTNISIPGRSNMSLIAFTSADSTARRPIDFFKTAPGQYPRFAEYTSSDSLLSGQGFDDTGVALRVALPFQNSNSRAMLRQYTGPATVFDSRVICVSPNLTISNIYSAGSVVSGKIAFEGSYPEPLMSTGYQSRDFLCGLPKENLSPNLPWSISVCDSGTGPLKMAPSIIPQGAPGQHMYLIFNVTSPSNKLMGWIAAQQLGNISANDVMMSKEGPWSTATFVSNDSYPALGTALDGAAISATACFTIPIGIEKNVTISSGEDGPEPVMTWDAPLMNVADSVNNSISHAYRYNTQTVRNQLGATLENLSRGERGIMALDNKSTDWSYHDQTDMPYGSRISAIFGQLWPTFEVQLELHGPSTSNTFPTAAMSYDMEPETQGNQLQISLFYDSLASTGSPAKALQAWFTACNLQQYLDDLPRFNIGSKAAYVFSVDVFVPTGWAGFVAVMTMITVHMILLSCVTVCYVVFTRYTMLGNIWQAVAQVASDATLPLLIQATNMKDKEVNDLIRREQASMQKYSVMRSRFTGRRELMAVL